MTTDFNLSRRRIELWFTFLNSSMSARELMELIEEQDKEFIRRLKALKEKYGSVGINYIDLFNEIDALAGDKLK